MRPVKLSGFLLSVATLVMAQEQGKVPERFHGKWAASQSRCGQTDESSLFVSEDRVDFYASRGLVLSVNRISELDIEVELESTGEGQVSRGTRRFSISKNGQTLTDLTQSKYPIARIRCK
jgi:hypothetical protein